MGEMIRRVSGSLALAAAALAMLVSGCASRGTVQDLRMEPYRPDEARPGAWFETLHGTGSSGAAVTFAPVGEAPAPDGAPASPETDVASVPAVVDEPAAPVPDAPVRRPLQKGDRVTISLFGIPDAPQQFEDVIDENGNVTLPHIGDMLLAGLTTAQAEVLIETTYVEREIYRTVNSTVISPDDEFYIRGEVKREGRYPMTGGMTLNAAISVAGGYTEYAKRRKVQIKRGELSLVFDMQDIEAGKVEDPLIRRGDIVIVPRRWVF